MAWHLASSPEAARPAGDILTGNSADNWFEGNAGPDTLAGLAGNDLLVGGAGADSFDCGADTGDSWSRTRESP